MHFPHRQDSLSDGAACDRGRLKPDARIALTFAMLYSVSLFCVSGWMGLVVLGLLLGAFGICMRPDMRAILVGLVPLYFILAFTVLAHIPQGVDVGLFYALRILLLAIATLMVSFAYDDTRLVRAFASMLSFLRRFGVPVDDIATMFSIALRFIPTSLDEIDRVRTAQASRGARFEEGGIAQRVKRWSLVFIPVIVGMFRRAESLACAMDARCYSGGKRTSLHADRLTAYDFAVLSFGTLVCVLTAVLA